MRTTNLLIPVTLFIFLFFNSCKKEENVDENEQKTEITDSSKSKHENSTPQTLSWSNDSTTSVNKTINRDYYYELDSLIFAQSANGPKYFIKDSAKIFFIQKTKTPSFFAFNNQSTGSTINFGTFYGYKIGSRVYYLEKYRALSERFVSEKGKSVIMTENWYPASGVTIHPAKTCFWITAVQRGEYKDIDDFLSQAIAVDKSHFNSCRISYRNKILRFRGETLKDKVLNFTKQALPFSDNPRNWNTNTWPGDFVSN